MKPTDSGKVGLPKIGPGENKYPRAKIGGGKGSKNDPAVITMGKRPEDQKGETKKQEAEDQKLLARIRKRFERCITFEADNRRDGLDDDKFVKGDQWPTVIQQNRKMDERPCLTINKLPTFIHQITNDQRQNRPTINISPVGEGGDIEAAKIYRGLIRAIERASTADIAYDRAFESAVRKGWGWFRLVTEFEKPDSFNQVLAIQSIRNAFTVYADPDHIEPDGADMKYCFVTEMIPRSEFEELYPDAQPIPFELASSGDDTKRNWVNKEEVRIAQYYEIENKPRKLLALSNGFTGWEDELDESVVDDLASGRLSVENERQSSVPKVMSYKVSALEVLERTPWVGKWIPLFKVIGDELDIEGKVTYSGIVRNAKDPQRTLNYFKTAEVELVALAPKAPYIMAEGQMEGHEDEWRTANTRSIAVLQYKQTDLEGKPAPPPQRNPTMGIPEGIVSISAAAAQDMMAVTGIRFDATLQERMIDESGRALHAIQRTTDLTNFHYVDNLSRTLKHLGRCLVDAIPKVYDTPRVEMILRDDDSEELIKIDPAQQKALTDYKDAQTGKIKKAFNPNVGEFGVTVTIGPSYATKRIEAAESMADFARAMPGTAEVFVDLIAKNSDWPGAMEISNRLAKLIAQKFPSVMTPDMKDVPPQVQAMLTSMDAQIKDLTQKLGMATKALVDKEADRAIEREKLAKDFEAKVLKIVADIDTKTAATHEKAVGQIATHAHAMADIGIRVGELIHKIDNPPEKNTK